MVLSWQTNDVVKDIGNLPQGHGGGKTGVVDIGKHCTTIVLATERQRGVGPIYGHKAEDIRRHGSRCVVIKFDQ